MSYADPSDVLMRYPPIETLVGTGDMMVSTVTVASVYIADAEGYVNAFLRSRYAIPLAAEPIITQVTADIAIYRMLEDHAPRIPDLMEKRWTNANSTLCMLRDGVMLLDPASQTIVSTGGDQEVWSTGLEQAGPVFSATEAYSHFLNGRGLGGQSMIEVELRNGVETKKFLADVDQGIKDGQRALFRSLGDVYVADVKHRIISQDDGKWAKGSKWLRAKKGHDRVLDGAEKYVRARVSNTQLAIVSTAVGWSLSQHHEGFVNQLVGPKEERDGHGRVVINIRDGRPLNLYVEMKRKRDGSSAPVSQTFAFVPKEPGVTPARKIWPTTAEAVQKGQPIASRWLGEIVNKAGGSLLHG